MLELSIEDLFRVLDNIVEIPQFNVGQTTTIRRDDSGWRPYDPRYIYILC